MLFGFTLVNRCGKSKKKKCKAYGKKPGLFITVHRMNNAQHMYCEPERKQHSGGFVKKNEVTLVNIT